MKLKALILSVCLMLPAAPVRADLWGGDIPLLIKIVANTLQTLYQLKRQTQIMKDQMAGIHDKINRIRTIERLIHPSGWEAWKDPNTAIRRLREINYTIPPEYRTTKSQVFELEMTRAMELAAQMTEEAKDTFRSGKQLERRGADASPGVAQKLTASGVGTLVSLQAQSQVAQSQMVSLLTQMLAEGAEKESRKLVSAGKNFKDLSGSLQGDEKKLSTLVVPLRMQP